MEEEYIGGVIEDPREDKSRDWQHKEFATAVVLSWLPKEQKDWKSYTLRNQDGSGSCVAQGASKSLETKLGEVMSAYPIYQERKNYPTTGMWLQDMGDILKKKYTVKEVDAPSQMMNDTMMNVKKDFSQVTDKYGIEGYVFVDCKDIDAIGSLIASGTSVVLTFGSNYQEWSDVPSVQGNVKWGHCVCGTDQILYNGQKAIVIEDSWGKFNQWKGQRVITEDFLKARCTGAMYFINPKKLDGKVHHTFNLVMMYGMKNDEVRILQDVLKQDGCFPTGVNSTGFYGNATAHAVDKFQRKYQVAPVAELDVLQGKRVGNRTLAQLNKLYAK